MIIVILAVMEEIMPIIRIHKFLFQWAKIFNEDVPCQNEMAHSL